MLDLMAQIPRENMEPWRALDVGGPSNLPLVPRATRLRVGRVYGALRHERHSFREMAAKDYQKGPNVADHVGGGVARKHERRGRSGHDREEHVVFEHLARRLAHDGQ